MNSQAPPQKKESPRILFSRVPHPLLMKSSYASKLCIHDVLVPLLSAIGRGEHGKYLFLALYGNTENPPVTARAPRIN